MNSKIKIADAGNVLVPAFLTLQQRGYTVRCQRAADGTQTWFAESATAELIADDPVTLLGLEGIAETRGAGWPASGKEIQDFLNEYDH